MMIKMQSSASGRLQQRRLRASVAIRCESFKPSVRQAVHDAKVRAASGRVTAGSPPWGPSVLSLPTHLTRQSVAFFVTAQRTAEASPALDRRTLLLSTAGGLASLQLGAAGEALAATQITKVIHKTVLS